MHAHMAFSSATNHSSVRGHDSPFDPAREPVVRSAWDAEQVQRVADWRAAAQPLTFSAKPPRKGRFCLFPSAGEGLLPETLSRAPPPATRPATRTTAGAPSRSERQLR